MGVKICKHCRWFHPGYNGFFVPYQPPYCVRETGKANLITGEPDKVNRPCEDERKTAPYRDTCGPEGRYHEARS